MNIDSAFPGAYLKAADLQGKTARVIIAKVVMEDVGDDHKPVIYFQGKERGLALNKTNANTIKISYGTDTEQWIGKPLELFEALVDFQGRQVPAIRVRVSMQNHAPRQSSPVMSNGRVTNDWQAPTGPGAMQPDDDPLSDSVPF